MTGRRYRYGRKALLFGDGGKGLRMQFHGIFVDVDGEWQPTQVACLAVQIEGVWSTRWTFADEDYPDMTSALDAYEDLIGSVAYG